MCLKNEVIITLKRFTNTMERYLTVKNLKEHNVSLRKIHIITSALFTSKTSINNYKIITICMREIHISLKFENNVLSS